ncbi:MAG: UvrD-helicase domain-containing protein, partial [Lachnospiraceae bacterium]|nr:UvrD-helicase domain-containing protein [Lachnospiraceae bacterium]
MPKIKHTPEQERVINLRGKSMLVSAAAGSGKTRVLVDRILSLITDEKNPIDIDKILVVTFTNAAAGEMKERICDALEEAYYKDPENRHLARQMAISHTAMVTTIDSFSNQILREFFSEIDLDPDFRTGDVGELELLHQECMDRIIEREYERADETFLRLTDIYRERGKDGSLKKIISAVFKRAESAPWPEDYIDHAADFYDIDTEDALFDSEVMRYTLHDIKSRLLSIEAVYERIIATLDPSDTPDKFIKIFPSDLSVVKDLLSKESVKDIMTYTLSFETLSRSKTPDDQKEREEYLKKKREELKNAVKKAIESVNGMAPSEILSVLRLSKPYANEIIRLTKLFREEFSLAKRKQGIIDFSDMEHMALSILIDKETGQCRPPAKELRERYSYVMVDEYQDSNEVQELLLKTVSGEDTGCYNYFMVGDVKQSIYRFRMAQPKIFMKKHALFGKENGNTERIDLNKNFRSRTEVLDIVNGIFSHIMKKDIGGIDYTDSEKLYPGAEFKDAPEGADAFTPEVLIAENDAEAIEELLMDDKEELEAAIIADRIDALMKNAVVTDPDTRELRPIRYSDICILLRSVKTKGEVFADTLKTHHIPSHVAGKKGY